MGYLACVLYFVLFIIVNGFLYSNIHLDNKDKPNDKIVISKYMEYLNKGSIEMKRIVVQKLGEYRKPAVVKQLILLLSSKDYLIRYYAKDSLVRLDILAIPFLIEALSNKSYRIRASCAEVLGRLGSSRGLFVVIKCIAKDRSPIVRASCAEALGNIGDNRAVDYLLKSLSDSSWKVRGASAKSLGILGDGRAVDPLIKRLNDSSNYVRLHVVGALGRLKSSKSVPFLIKALQDSNSDTREIAAWALGKIKDKRAIRALAYVLVRDRNGNVRKEAREALRKMGYSYEEIDRYSRK